MSMNRICPLTRKGMPPLNREKNREQYECLGDECMWHIRYDGPDGRTSGCSMAFAGITGNNGSWSVNRREM